MSQIPRLARNDGLLYSVTSARLLNGTLTASVPVPVMFGSFVTGAPAAIDIDIYANGATNPTKAFLMKVTAMGSSSLYRLNLTTGIYSVLAHTAAGLVTKRLVVL